MEGSTDRSTCTAQIQQISWSPQLDFQSKKDHSQFQYINGLIYTEKMSTGVIISQVKKLLEKNEIELANQKLEPLLKGEAPAEALLLDAMIKIRKGDPDCTKYAWTAFKKAEKGGYSPMIASCLEHLGISLFKVKSYDDALAYALHAQKLDSQTPSIQMLVSMIERKYMKKHNLAMEQLKAAEREILNAPIPIWNGADDHSEIANESPAILSKDTSSVKETVETNIKHDWFDSGKAIEISLYVKKIDSQSIKLNIQSRNLEIAFKDSNHKSFSFKIEKLAGEIIPGESSHKVYGTKMELILPKADERHWSTLQIDPDFLETEETFQIPKTDEHASGLQYPSSSSKKIDWSKIDLDENEDEENADSGDPESFFRQLYENADDDAKRAMMKSFMESNGTSLSTDWGDVGSREVKPYSEEESEVENQRKK